MRWLPRRRSASSIAMMPVPTRPALRHGQCADCRPHRPGTGERRRAGRGRRCRADGGGAADRPHLRELRAARCRGDAVAEADPRGRAARRGAGPGAGAPGAAGWVRVRARRHAVVRRPGRGPRHGQRDDASAVR
ncbi:hypothetical protein G6F40_014769 [Rhizopus arrhizus]|nr:hypothetical protein G6F40_014769 [Rhizopus arrhizus]